VFEADGGLSDEAEHPSPSGFGKEAHDFLQPLRDARPLISIPISPIGKVDNPRFALDVASGQKTPVPAIHAVIAVVAHDKALARGDDNGTKVIPDRIVVMVILVPRVDLRIVVDFIFLDDRLVIDVDLFVPDLNLLSFDGDDPLDKIFGQILGVFEDDDIMAPKIATGQENFFNIGVRGSIGQLVDEKEISDEKSWFHRASGDLEGLDNKGHDKEDEDGCLGDELKIFPKDTLFTRLFLFFH